MRKHLAGIAILGALAGCMGGGTATDFVAATAGMRGAIQATEPPSEADYALNCSDVNTRVNNLQARYAEIEAEQRREQRRQGMISGAIGVGTTLLGGSALASAGSAEVIRNTGMAVNVTRSALSGLSNQENNAEQLRTINDATLIATRMAQLQRVAFTNGC